MSLSSMKSGVRIGASIFVLVGVLAAPTIGYSETEGQERRDDRKEVQDTRQTGRESARDAKEECREGDEKSRAECRQEKRDTKQGVREDAREKR